MSAQAKTTESQVSLELNRSPWIVAISGGLLGGAAMGLLMQFWMDAMPAIGALYGQPTLTAGWAAHLVHSILFALLFVAAIRETPISKYATNMQNIIGLGALYGVVLTIIAAFVMPLWLNTVANMGMAVPSFSIPSLTAHIVFGVLVAGVYALARRT